MATAYPSPQKSVYTKRALLIGNNTYKKRNQLRFCINDAEDLAKKLSDIDFKITIDTNLTNAQMERIIKTFINEINSGDLVLFFFAGHAYQYDGLNYLLPIDDDRRKDEIDLKDRSINAQVTLQKMMRRQPSASIFLLDCCRSSFSTPGTANTSGLSAMYAAAGSLIAFACAAGEIALDESPNGRNGLFTSHLLQHVHLPNLSIDEIMYNVCAGVIKDSRGNQYPFRVNSLRRKIILNQQDQTGKSIN